MSKKRFDSQHLDSAQNAFFNRQLEFIRPEVFRFEFPEFKGRSLVPVDNSAPSAAESITTRWSTDYSQVRAGSDYASESPRVDLLRQEASIPVRALTVSYGYSVQEIRAASLEGMNLDAEKARIAREAVERELDDMMFLGASPSDKYGVSMVGLLTVASPTVYTVPNPGSGTEWENKNPDEIIADMHGAVTKVITDTKEIERPDTMLLPLSSYELIATTRMGDGSDMTILRHFLANSEYVRRVEKSYKSETAGAGGVKRMTVYRNDPSRMQFSIPQEFEQFAPQEQGLQIIIPCHARVAGLDVHRPKSVCYGDGI